MQIRNTVPHYVIALFLCTLILSGCHKYSTMDSVEGALKIRNLPIAAERVRRCAKDPSTPLARRSPDYEECNKILERVADTGEDIEHLIFREYQERLYLERIMKLRASNNPWGMYALAIEIQLGKTKEEYPGEKEDIFQKAFVGFGECALNTDPDCMAQYASMLLAAKDDLPDKEASLEAALYWFELSARYGIKEARKALLSLRKDIPSPDLAMERLQEEANAIGQRNYEIRVRDAEIQRQILVETRRQNRILAANQLMRNMATSQSFTNNRSFSCTSNNIGNYTYTNCN